MLNIKQYYFLGFIVHTNYLKIMKELVCNYTVMVTIK